MSDIGRAQGSGPRADHEFRLGDWLVQPRLNRLSRASTKVQLEPKLMDVLSLLAARAERVVSKQEINDIVWSGVFVTESVITRAIAGLRRALGDSAQSPRFIETISKRGYRLMIRPEPAHDPAVSEPQPGDAVGAAAAGAAGLIQGLGSAGSEATVQTGPSPYVVGQWVRAERFYGRERVLSEVLRGTRGCIWLLGLRRIGKTSVLKQLELLTSGCDEGGFVPVYWDLEGAQGPEELHLELEDALLDAGDRLDRLGIDVDDLCAGDGRRRDVFSILGRLRRALLAQSRSLLLLCDEAEELIHLSSLSPALLRRLRNALHARDGIRTVIASSPRLWGLADAGEQTSPFLEPFLPPLVLGPLSDQSTRSLIRQDQLAPELRPSMSESAAGLIRAQSAGHPYLTQMLCRRVVDRGSVDAAVEGLVSERTTSFFFAVDHELLTPVERALVRGLAHQPAEAGALISALESEIGELDPVEVGAVLRRLAELGQLTRSQDSGRYEIAGPLLRSWLLANS